MSEIKFAYFDIGGVLFHWRDGLKNLALVLNNPYEKIVTLFDKYDDEVCRGKITPQQFWEYCKEELSSDIKMDDFLDWWFSQFYPIKTMHELLLDISKKYRVGLLSNLYTGASAKMVKKKLIPDINYDAFIKSCELGMVKPEEAIFKYAEDKAGVRPNEILFIDDSQVNIDKAKKLGWNAVVFDEYNQEKAIKEIKNILNI